MKEMQRFVAMAVDDPLWPRICNREKDASVLDGVGCTEKAYENATKYIEPFFDAFSDE